ncbi:MAG: DUF2752 domain-containing protein [Bacteroidota bacterium]
MMKNSKQRLLLESIILLLILSVLLFLPADFFDEGQSMCLSVQLFGKECYACGMTRSIMHLIHLDFSEALFYNPLGLIVAPAIGFFLFLRLRKKWKLAK